ncbi:MAG: hypothetical protein PVH61_03815 [Candidatus Aminicenantes bacterium]|jgi:hypothetical protein
MRKIRVLVITTLTAVLLLSTTACKRPVLEITWNELAGSGTYNSLDNTSTIKLSGSVALTIPTVATDAIRGEISAWEFIISEGEVIVLYINSDLSYEVLGDYTLDQSEERSDFLWIDIETVIPRTGDMYNGANPDTVSLTLWIEDDSDNTYTMRAAAPFQLTRE